MFWRFLTQIPLILFVSCSLAPMGNMHTARTNGKGNWNVDVGANQLAAPYIRLGGGLFENFDLGFTYEQQAISILLGLYGKFAIINQQEGLALSVEGGVGTGFWGKYKYIGPAISYKFGWFEPYFVARYNKVSTDDQDIKTDEEKEGITIHLADFEYMYYTAGATFWPLKWFGLNVNANWIDGKYIDTEDGTIFGGGLIFKF